MDSPQTMTDDQNKFNKDLANLINSAAAMASAARKSPSSVPTTPSPSKDPRLRKRAAPQQSAVKKIKLEHSSDAQDGTNVHPSRLPLVDGHTEPPMSTRSSPAPLTQFSELQLHHQMQLLQRTGSNRVPLGNSKRRTNKSLDAYTLSRHDSAVSNESAALVSNIPRAINEDIAPPNTLRDAVWRQWDSSKDGLPYEQLLEKRRTEQLGSKVDRYVPSLEVPKDRRIAYRLKSSSFPFAKLPEKVRAKILSLLLVKNDCIIIDFTWLRSFVNGHCRVPIVEKTVKDREMSAYTVPMNWTQLVKDVDTMRKDCMPFKPALEDRGNKTRQRKAPCRGLTTAVLFVSKDMHAQAAPIFYGGNNFRFPWASSAWMQLESFLATIGSQNVSELRHITVHCPLWHRGIKEDYLEGAVLDLTSPASRLGVVKSSSRDRLLSAIAWSVEALSKAGNLKTFAIDLEHGLTTERWAGSYSNSRRLIAMNEADEHVSRKQEGVKLLKSLSESLPSQPVVTIHHQKSGIGKHDLSEFRSRLAGVIREAAKYGWKVDQQLKSERW